MRRLAAFAIACLASTLTGCLDVESEARVAKDGGGTFTETVTVDLEALAKARRIFKQRTSALGAEPDALPPFRRFDPNDWVRQLRAADGIDGVTSERVDSPEGTRRHVLRGRFTDLAAYYTAGPVDDVEAALWKIDDGKAWRLEARSLYDDEQIDPASRKTLLTFRTRLLAPFRSALKNLRIQRVLVLPTRVRDANGIVSADKRRVTWTLTFDDIADPANLRQWVVFEHAEDLTLTAFGEPPQAEAPARAAAPTDKDGEDAKDSGKSAGGDR